MKNCFFYIAIFFFTTNCFAQHKTTLNTIEKLLANPPESAKPWVFWYWVNGCVSKQGVTADLEAMQRVGLGGAYLMFIKDTTSKIDFQPQIRQLSPEWFAMVSHAMQEAKRLKLKIGLHFSDGFALAGGPWIKPAQSMQKLVWSKMIYSNWHKNVKVLLPQPETNEGYYEDIKTYAYRLNYKPSKVQLISIADNKGTNLFYLTQKDSSKTYRSDTTCFIDFTYDNEITLRQIHIKKQNNAYQAQRFILQKSKDGINYFTVDTLVPPHHGWQDNSYGYTHSVKNFTSKYIRLLWQKEGTAPGSEELDAAKWKPVLRVQGIYLSEEPTINNIEAKNGSVWRKANATTMDEVTNATIVQPNDIIDVTKFMIGNVLRWQPNDDADYRIVRIGHTSTRQQNETAGGGKGLECDKLNTKAVTIQYNNWFKNIFEKTNAVGVVNTVHIDSWECGSQNWTADFLQQFEKINKYSLDKFLLAATGTPIASVEKSEKVLFDYRNTIATLMNQRFFGTIQALAKKDNLQISAESTAPTFVADGLAHYKNVDMPMGEFWFNSPTHDKPTDMADAINAAHIYGKNIVGAEAFTTLRMDWSESPQTLKAIGDRAFANGINKMIIHVMVHNPWMNKKPGMTLDGIGLYYQRDQPWFEQSKAWIDYLTRTSALLQLGKPVVDVAVFTGEEMPSRSILPDKLISTLPGIFGDEIVQEEKKRLENINQPLRTIPDGVTHSANMADPENYIDALNGYKYDCFNTDVLMQMIVKNKIIYTKNGMKYKVLVIPNTVTQLSNIVKNKLLQLANTGATILMDKKRFKIINNKIIQTPYTKQSFTNIGIEKDVEIMGSDKIVWTHRNLGDLDIYFFSNQEPYLVNTNIVFPFEKKDFTMYNAVDGNNGYFHKKYAELIGKTQIGIDFYANQSYFIVFRPITNAEEYAMSNSESIELNIQNWLLEFKGINKKIEMKDLNSWAILEDSTLKYYSGKVRYTSSFTLDSSNFKRAGLIHFDQIYNSAIVKINGINCGTLWTAPYSLEISKAIKSGNNIIEIEVANTWHNALIGNELHKDLQQKTFTNAPFRLKDKPLLPAGIIGTVKIVY